MEQLDTILDGVVTPIVYVDADLRYCYVNRSYAEWYKKSKPEIERKYIHELLAEDVYQRSLRSYQKVLSGELVYFGNRAMKDGEERYVGIRFVPHFKGERVVGFFSSIMDITELRSSEAEKERLIQELQESLAKVKTLSGLVPICASCKNIRDDKGYWNQIDNYIEDHSDAMFSHGTCPDCVERMYAGQDWYEDVGRKEIQGNTM
ncbi:MAG: PAS domain-containing protein [Thermodesulfobacteriota bacterium]